MLMDKQITKNSPQAEARTQRISVTIKHHDAA
jgi:hypothetical protein